MRFLHLALMGLICGIVNMDQAAADPTCLNIDGIWNGQCVFITNGVTRPGEKGDITIKQKGCSAVTFGSVNMVMNTVTSLYYTGDGYPDLPDGYQGVNTVYSKWEDAPMREIAFNFTESWTTVSGAQHFTGMAKGLISMDGDVLSYDADWNSRNYEHDVETVETYVQRCRYTKK